MAFTIKGDLMLNNFFSGDWRNFEDSWDYDEKEIKYLKVCFAKSVNALFELLKHNNGTTFHVYTQLMRFNMSDEPVDEFYITYTDGNIMTVDQYEEGRDFEIDSDNELIEFTKRTLFYGDLPLAYISKIEKVVHGREPEVVYTGCIAKSWNKIKAIPRMLGLHKRSTETANHPDRLRGMTIEEIDEYQKPARFGKKRKVTNYGMSLKTINKWMKYLNTF